MKREWVVVAFGCSYEAWVVYNFLALCMAYVGGPGQVVVQMEGQNVKVRSMPRP